jgi:hypothetical protein
VVGGDDAGAGGGLQRVVARTLAAQARPRHLQGSAHGHVSGDEQPGAQVPVDLDEAVTEAGRPGPRPCRGGDGRRSARRLTDRRRSLGGVHGGGVDDAELAEQRGGGTRVEGAATQHQLPQPVLGGRSVGVAEAVGPAHRLVAHRALVGGGVGVGALVGLGHEVGGVVPDEHLTRLFGAAARPLQLRPEEAGGKGLHQRGHEGLEELGELVLGDLGGVGEGGRLVPEDALGR